MKFVKRQMLLSCFVLSDLLQHPKTQKTVIIFKKIYFGGHAPIFKRKDYYL